VAALGPAPRDTPAGSLPDLQWPLQPAPGFDPFGYHGTGYFVDHDPRFPGLLQDYTCGTRTYDLDSGYNHNGTDYYLWPYPWLMMDSEQVRIVAAAPGAIVEKIDGNFDRDCAIAGNGGFNAVFVQQDDGLTAWYLHMKNGSLTTKAVGARVEAGEFLGLVGSSGPSSLPHLHFELHDAANDVVDPLHGACNAAPDRWIVPQPYESPRIDTLTTHSSEPALVDCGVANGIPVHEEPHFADSFAPGATLWAFASYSDHRNGEITHFSVLRPDASIEASWDFDLASENLPKPFYSGTAWDWSVTLPADAPAGTWILQAEFEGQLYQHVFTVTRPSQPHGHSHHGHPAREPPVRR
ncbi:MAG TPA: M23 family metallopeptidase, partial [Rhodanobacteraceae bacterium]|nr:M23 family metallopeptidase [Rhodanobacteraceae bacterium]